MSADESKRDGAVQAASGEAPREHEGGPRFSRRVLIMVSVGAVVVGVVTAEGIRTAGVKTTSAVTQVVDDGAAAARNQAEVEDLAAGSRAPVMPGAAPAAVVPMPSAQTVVAAPPKAPSRYAEWAPTST